jgi:GntR family transcriptional regulator
LQRAPLYEQVANDLRRRIRAHEFGDTLPSQEELCKLLEVSRSTLREAMRMLELEGLVKVRRGMSTAIPVDSPRFSPGLETLASISSIMARSGYDVATKELVVDLLRENTDYPELPDAPLVRIERVRTAGATPVLYSLEVIVGNEETRDSLDPYLKTGSLLAWLQADGRGLDYARTTIGAKSASRREAKRLEVSERSALVSLEQVGYTQRDEAVYAGYGLYRPDLVQFHILSRSMPG